MNRFALSPTRLAASIAATMLTVASAHAAVVGANWSSESGGTLNGVAYTFAGSSNNFTGTLDISGAEFGAYALSASQNGLILRDSGTWSVTFASPITNLFLYDVTWRPGATFTFSQPFTVLAGNGTAAVTSTTLTTTGGPFDLTSGVLQFAGPITMLSLSNVAAASGRPIGLTFGVDPAAAVPEPGTLALWAAGVGLLAAVGARRGVRKAA